MFKFKFHPMWLVPALLLLMAPLLRSQARACDPTGTWYGGGNEVKYLMTITPDLSGGYTVLAVGAFSSESLGFPVATQYSGSLVIGPHKRLEISSVFLAANTTGFPVPTPELWAVHGFVKFTDCDSIKVDYDFFGAYYWTSNKVPFVSDPDYVIVPPPFTETYLRMPVKRPPNPKHEMDDRN